MAKKIIRLTETDLNKLVKRVLRETPMTGQEEPLVNKTREMRNQEGQIAGGSYPQWSIRKVKNTYGETIKGIKTVNVDKFGTGLVFDMADGTQFSVKCS